MAFTSGHGDALRRAGTTIGIAALAASFVVGSDLFGSRESLFGSAAPPPQAAAFSRIATDAPGRSAEKTVLRSSPWWQKVGSLRGTGPGSATPAVGDSAIQWRMNWRCTSGRFRVTAPGVDKPLIDAICPGRRVTEVVSVPTGPLRIDTPGAWEMQVEQQVDVPLDEPPLAAMRAPGARRLATGSFYRIDQVGRGRVTIQRLPNGRYALRLQDFYVTPNIDLEIRLSPLRAPRTTGQYKKAPAVWVGELDVTTGNLNFVLPKGIDPRRYRSVVLWCENLYSAYAAATLKPMA